MYYLRLMMLFFLIHHFKHGHNCIFSQRSSNYRLLQQWIHIPHCVIQIGLQTMGCCSRDGSVWKEYHPQDRCTSNQTLRTSSQGCQEGETGQTLTFQHPRAPITNRLPCVVKVGFYLQHGTLDWHCAAKQLLHNMDRHSKNNKYKRYQIARIANTDG